MRIAALLATISIVACGVPVAAAGFNYSVWLAAHPQVLVADGRSETTISAEVRNSSGGIVPDNTMVEFTTSLGTIERIGRTTAGVARVRLQSSLTVGTAMVSAVVAAGQAVAQLRVEFLEPGTEISDESFITVSSRGHLGYDAGERLIDSAGGVKIYHRGLEIDADQAQIDLKRTVLRAKNGKEDITIRRGDKQVAASALYYDFNAMSGVILTPAETGARRMTLRGRDLLVQEDANPDKLATFDFTPIGEAAMFIKARSIVVRPGEEIKFTRAEFFLDGDRVLGVPLHVESLKSQGSGVSRILTYGTEGLRLDLPFYYSLTPNGTGAVRLRHAQPGGWGYYSGPSGWQVDLEQEYTRGGSTEGKLSLNRITSGDWGARWTQRREFDNDSQIYSFLDFPAHRSLYGSFDYSRSFRDYTVNAYMRGDKVRGRDGRYSSSAYLQTRAKPLAGGALTYAVSSRFSFDSLSAPGTSKLGTGVGLQLYGRPMQFGSSSGLATSVQFTHDWGGSYPGSTINANAGYYRSLGRIGQLGLNYTYSWADAIAGYTSQRVSADLSLTPSDRWRAYLYLTKGLTDESTSAFGEISYAFSPTWRIHVLGTVQDYYGFTYRDTEIALAKAIGRQEARIIWSQSRKKLRVEFSALSF